MSFFETPAKIGGMTICSAAQTLTPLNQAGFSDTKIFKTDKGRIYMTARK